MNNLTIKSFENNIAIVSYGDDYYDKQILIPDEFIINGILSESSFLLYCSGFSPDIKPVIIKNKNTKLFVPNTLLSEKLIVALNNINTKHGDEYFKWTSNPNDEINECLYDYRSHAECISVIDNHKINSKKFTLALTNKAILNETLRLVNLDYSYKIPVESMKTPYIHAFDPPTDESTIRNFFDGKTMITNLDEKPSKVIVKPIYGWLENCRIYDRKVYSNADDLIADIILEHGDIETFFANQSQKRFILREDNKLTCPVFIQHYHENVFESFKYDLLIYKNNFKYMNSNIHHAFTNVIEALATACHLKNTYLSCSGFVDNNGIIFVTDISLSMYPAIESYSVNELENTLEYLFGLTSY